MSIRWRRSTASASDILVICTGNVCRSPYIAALIAAQCPGLTVVSAGVGALVGELPGEPVLRALRQRRLDADVLVPAQKVTRAMARGARLIITATRQHRVAIVSMDRSAQTRTFTLKELARLLAGVESGLGIDGILRVAGAHVGTETVDHDDDLADPYGLEWPAYEAMAVDVDAALAVLVPALQADPAC